MKVVGIVAEYNPFHNGHKYQIDYARNVLGANYIVVAMSGGFTQRGSIACYDKYTRAKTALLSGADLVFEIPAIFATSSASEFAAAGVSLLASTGIVDTILFGSESNDIDSFIENAKNLIKVESDEDFQNKLARYLSEGESYAAAFSKAVSAISNIKIFDSPNDILGLEYTKFILQNSLPIKPVCLKREGNDYNDTSLTGSISSATAIRKELESQRNIKDYIPLEAYETLSQATYINENDISSMLHYKLLSENDFSNYLDCNEDISNRINKLKSDFSNFEDFVLKLKSKNISLTRARRILCHILLGITAEDFLEEKNNGYIRYLRLLGFSKKGSALLSQVKDKGTVPMSTEPSDYISEFDIVASDIQRIIITQKTGTVLPNEYTRKFNLVNL